MGPHATTRPESSTTCSLSAASERSWVVMTTVRPRGPLLLDHVEDALAADHVEAGDGLVEQQELALLGQALGHEDPLALAAGELAEVAVDQIADLQPLDGLLDDLPVGGTDPARRRPVRRSGPCRRLRGR